MVSFFSGLIAVAIQLLSFWVPIAYAFKFLMDKEIPKLKNILKFWCVITLYNLIALALEMILDENVFPWVNLIALSAICLPPYETAEKIYDVSLGNIFSQNKEAFLSAENTIRAIFEQNSEKFSKKVQEKTGQKMKGVLGGIIVSAMNNSSQPSTADIQENSDDNSIKSD